MPATSPGSEHFGWPQFYEEPEQYWEQRDQAWREQQAERAVHAALAILRERGLLREDRLSYTRICELEHETGISAGSWIDYLNALHEAELQDREIWNTT